MKTLLTLVAVLLLSFSVNAENENSIDKVKTEAVSSTESVKSVLLKGNVSDKENNETLAGATIYIDGEKVYTDLDGNFSLDDLKPGKHILKAELISYETAEMEVNINQNSNLKIHLVQK